MIAPTNTANGMIHATTLKPVEVGAASDAAPLLDATLPTAPADPMRIAVIRALCSLVVSLVEAGAYPGALVVVDDAHWSDNASLRFLVSLAERLGDLPVVVMVCARPGEDAKAGLLARLAAHPRTRILRPGPLDPASVAEIIAERYGTQPDPVARRKSHDDLGTNRPRIVVDHRAVGRAEVTHGVAAIVLPDKLGM